MFNQRKISNYILIIAILVGFMTVIFPIFVEALDVPKYGVFNLTLIAEGNYSNPYLEMPGDDTSPGFVVGTFTGPSNETITIDGFWDGGNTWKIRMAPTAIGMWTYTTSSSDSGLDGKSGSFSCVASNHKGFVCINPQYPHSFMRADGSPLFLLGDTSWRRAWGDDYFSKGCFQQMVECRASHGFTAFTNASLVYNGPLINEGGAITLDGANGDQLNPAFFQWCDKRLAYMNDRGMIPLIMLGSPDHGLTTNKSKLVRLQRYLIARWAAYDVFWHFVKEYEEWGTSIGISIVRELGKVCDMWDPYSHPTSTHTLRTTSRNLGNEAWLDFNSQQRRDYKTMVSDFNKYSKPVVVTEYYYEWITYSSSKGWQRVMNDPIIRESLWKIQLSGAYNAGYQLVHDSKNRLTRSYLDNLDSSSAQWHKHLRDFFVSKTEFWKLAPNNDLVKSGSAYAAADPGNEYVLYLELGGNVTVDLSATSGTLKVEWYNPRTGKSTSTNSVSAGAWSFFSAPESNDWVLHIYKNKQKESMVRH